MKKKFYITLFLSIFMFSRSAYAIFDIMGAIQSALELKKEIENQIQEVMKFKEDLEKRVKQGFAMASSCFKNPMKCDVKGFDKLIDTGAGGSGVTRNNNIPVMPGAEKLKQDLTNIAEEDLGKIVKNTYRYTKTEKKDLQAINQNRANINGVIVDEISMEFAKGAATRHSIQAEDDSSLYPNDFGKDTNVDKVLDAQNRVGILTASRLARIIELRANMNSAEATVTMTETSNKTKSVKRN